METQQENIIQQPVQHINMNKLKQETIQELQMTSSTLSVTDSLASPVDSGVQLLDSESEMTSVMSNSGIGYDIIDYDLITKVDVNNKMQSDKLSLSSNVNNYFDKFELPATALSMDKSEKELLNKGLSDEVFEMEHPIKTVQSPIIVDNNNMHISMSEEVNENLIIDNKPLIEEQIVFRRQRKKKSKSDTPKKRVSFHEDILNSTKINDIHINHGFITHESDNLNFFQRNGFLRNNSKHDIVKGRYSWAAEGDYYTEKLNNEREIKSDIYTKSNPFSSTSSSSIGSSSSSSIDEESCDDLIKINKKEPTLKQPKSSCLKKTKHTKKYIDTNIVHEDNNKMKKRCKDDFNNIFGSLKNILNFSTSVPLAERGVPEGQEDITLYSKSLDNRRKSCINLTFDYPIITTTQALPTTTTTVELNKFDKLNLAKTNLKLTKSEGFYPNYPNNQQNLPENIILCDSNVYEHKGISYSYEYDKFQKNFHEEKEKTKNSLKVYQTLLKEFNFFRKKAKQNDIKIMENSLINVLPIKNDSVEEVVEDVNVKKCIINTCKIDWSTPSTSTTTTTNKIDWSDTETTSDFSENNTRHLNSPKRKINKLNHYSLSPFKLNDDETSNSNEMILSKSLPNLKQSTLKNSLINRFLRNVTLKKMLDMKVENKQKNCKKYLNLYIKSVQFKYKGFDEIDKQLNEEILKNQNLLNRNSFEENFDKKLLIQFKKIIFRDAMEKLLGVFPVRSAYATNGESKSLLVILTNTTLYIAGMKQDINYCNHFVLPYTELNIILVGPNAQTIHFSNYDKDMQCIITTGCTNITNNLIGQLEMAMRRDIINKPKLAAIKQLNMRDMYNLRRSICKQTSVDKNEEYFYYSIVNIQDFNSDVIETTRTRTTPLGPNKEGPLMFKTSLNDLRWETAYFILKAGVLYMLSSASQRIPMRLFPLINGSCQGARRLFNCHRPHTFQLIIEGKNLYLAAPDEYVASEWLQCLVHAASGNTFNQRDKNFILSCSLLMTSDHILTVREAFSCTIPSLLTNKLLHEPIKGAQALSCAGINDLMAFRLPSAEQSWCILEFSCREVHECSGDWILYFATNSELEQFISTLEMLWAYNNENDESFPLSTIPETDPLSKKCVDIYNSLQNSWPINTVHLQFL